MHQPNGVLPGNRIRLEGGLLTNQAGSEHGIEIVLGRLAAQGCFIGQREKRLPDVDGNIAEFAGVHIGDGGTCVGHARAKVPLIKGCLRGFQKEPWGRAGKVSVLEFLFGRRVKGNRAECLRTLPTLLGGNGNRLIKWTKGGRRWNFFEKFGRIFFARTKFGKTSGSSDGEISFGETLDRFVVEAAGMRDISRTFRAPPQPVKSVDGVRRSGILHQKIGQAVVRIGLMIEVSDPGNAPFAVVSVPAIWKRIQGVLISNHGFLAFQFHPVVIPCRHQAVFVPFADGVRLREGVQRIEHFGLFFRVAVSLRQCVQPFRVDVEIRGR